MILSIVLIALGILLIIEYIPPLLDKAVLDAGNAFGLTVAALCLTGGIFRRTLHSWITALWQTSSGKALLLAVISAVTAFLLCFLCTLWRVLRFGKMDADGQTTVIVLGCKVNGTAPSIALRKRTMAAAAYLQSHPEAVAILSGGQGKDEGISEGACMKNILLAEGIDESRLYVEDRSTSTEENFAFSKEIIQANGFSTAVAVATHDYHQLRAAMIAGKYGLTPASLPATSSHWSRATFYTREVFGIWQQWLKRSRQKQSRR